MSTVATNDKPKVSKIFGCECYAEGIEVAIYDPCDGVEICMWERGTGPYARTLKDKLRWIFHILKTGRYWTDDVILSSSTAREMGHALISLSDEVDKLKREESSTN